MQQSLSLSIFHFWKSVLNFDTLYLPLGHGTRPAIIGLSQSQNQKDQKQNKKRNYFNLILFYEEIPFKELTLLK